MKARPNDPCPCGSGGKYKKCCGAPGKRTSLFTPADRGSALQKLLSFVDEVADVEEQRTLSREFFGDFPPDPGEAEGVLMQSFFAFQWWMTFDTREEGAPTFAELALQEPGLLTHGERLFVKAALDVRMRLYEVAGVVPGESVRLRDMIDDAIVEVSERTASRTLQPWDVLATRVFPVGSSGRPEMDGDVFAFRRDRREKLLADVRELLATTPDDRERAARNDVPAHLIESWRAPSPLPHIVNQDGDELVATRVFFDARSPKRLAQILDAAPFLERDADAERWRWTGASTQQPDSVLLGTVARKAKRLVLETNSVERAREGRELLEGALGDLVTYRATETSDVMSGIERDRAAKPRRPVEGQPRPGIPPDLMATVGPQLEAMMKAHYARWVDEPVPMLDGKTPREAASGPLRPRVVEALKDLENMYARAKAEGQPAFDPKDLWRELGIERPRH